MKLFILWNTDLCIITMSTFDKLSKWQMWTCWPSFHKYGRLLLKDYNYSELFRVRSFLPRPLIWLSRPDQIASLIFLEFCLIWSQICSIGLRSYLHTGHSMTTTSTLLKKLCAPNCMGSAVVRHKHKIYLKSCFSPRRETFGKMLI